MGTITGLTEEQIKLVCFILDEVYKANRVYIITDDSISDFKQKINKETILTEVDLKTVINFLEVKDWIEPYEYFGSNCQHKISDWAWDHLHNGGSFVSHYKREQEYQEEFENSVELDKQIKELTKTHLEKSIRKMRWWYALLTMIIATIMTIITTIGIDYIKQQSGIFKTEHHEQD